MTRSDPHELDPPGAAPPPRRMHGEDRYAIFPVVDPKSGGKRWLVNLSRGGRSIQLSFPHLKYGGEAPALAIAQACRDAILAVVPPMTHRDMRKIKRRNGSGGMPGVYHIAGDARHAEGWVAQILLPSGRTRRRTFSVANYGKAGARRHAEAERQRLLDEVENIETPALRSPAAIALGARLAAVPKDLDGLPPAGIVRQGGIGPHWRVRVQAGGLKLNRRFVDATFGGKLPALFVARAFREAVLTFVPPTTADVPGFRASH